MRPVGRNWSPKAHLAVLLPHLRMLPTENLGIEVAIALCWDSLRVGLAADLDALVVDERDVFGDERVVECLELESRNGRVRSEVLVRREQLRT